MSFQQNNFKKIADKIREKTDTDDLIAPSAFPEKIDEVFEAGKKTQHDLFWDNFQQYGERTNFNSAFEQVWWTDSNFDPKYDLNPTSGMYMFRFNKITDLAGILERNNVKLNLSNMSGGDGFNYMFYNNSMTIIPDLDCSTSTYLNNLFSYSRNLHTIKSLTVGQNTSFINTFNQCIGLKNLTIKGIIGNNGLNVSYSQYLTHNSLMSILNCLQDKTNETSGESRVCTLGDVNLKKLSDSEKAIATEKGWSLA